jgi:hypothetical protein
MEEWIIPVIAIALVLIGLVGHGFEMRKIRTTIYKDEDFGPPNIFTNKRNFKWYVLIGTGLILWYVTGGYPQ